MYDLDKVRRRSDLFWKMDSSIKYNSWGWNGSLFSFLLFYSFWVIWIQKWKRGFLWRLDSLLFWDFYCETSAEGLAKSEKWPKVSHKGNLVRSDLFKCTGYSGSLVKNLILIWIKVTGNFSTNNLKLWQTVRNDKKPLIREFLSAARL